MSVSCLSHPLCLLHSQAGLNDVEAIPDIFSLTFYLLSIPVERAISLSALLPKIPGLTFFVSDWCSLGHMLIPEPIPVARTTLYLLLVRTGSRLPLKPIHGQAHLEPQGSRGRTIFPEKYLNSDANVGRDTQSRWMLEQANQ